MKQNNNHDIKPDLNFIFIVHCAGNYGCQRAPYVHSLSEYDRFTRFESYVAEIMGQKWKIAVKTLMVVDRVIIISHYTLDLKMQGLCLVRLGQVDGLPKTLETREQVRQYPGFSRIFFIPFLRKDFSRTIPF